MERLVLFGIRRRVDLILSKWCSRSGAQVFGEQGYQEDKCGAVSDPMQRCRE